jgi:cell division protease FtsH
VLLVGPPGTGKTMLAKAIANEAGVAFYSLSGGDFQSMWAGVGTNRIRMAYEQARRSGKPAIVFIDEIDAIAQKRGQDLGGGAIQDSNKTLNQLLVELDGFGKHKVLTIGATNNAKALDAALLRPGRFDRRIEIDLPNLDGREAILNHYLKDRQRDQSVQPLEIARMTVFGSGADLANVVNEAGLVAIREGRPEITQKDLIKAIQRVHFGLSRSGNINLAELWETAYHEAGHAIVAYLRNRRTRLQVITIIPTGQSLGYTWATEKEDRFQGISSKQELLVTIETALGGYAAEELYMNTTTTGAGDDLTKVARIARRMIKSWGMGSFKFDVDSAFGNLYSGSDTGLTGSGSSQSEQVAEAEIKQLVDDCLDNARNLLKTKRNELDKVAKALVEKETLHYRDLVAIMEPHRTEADIERELATMSERRLVGKPPVINLDFMPGLASVTKNGEGNGKSHEVGGTGLDTGPASGSEIQAKSTGLEGDLGSQGPIN